MNRSCSLHSLSFSKKEKVKNNGEMQIREDG